MAKYKVWLTVKDSYGKTKELDGGNIAIDLTTDDVGTIIDAVKDNIVVEAKTPVYVPEVTNNNMLKFKRTDGITEEELEFDIDKSNDWDKIENSVSSSFIWESMR